mmetsp:Transcript_10285/g.22030  ORF Transcript_10285/g.22030 Transcript_10285/m.22030 type:complete len:333 (-) Transcript_10285:346-1344(-)
MAALSNHLSRGHLLTLGPSVHKIVGLVVPRPERSVPTREITIAEEHHTAPRAVVPFVHAILLGLRLLVETFLLVFIRTCDRASLNTLPASHTALGPFRDMIHIAPGDILTALLGWGLWRKRAFVVVTGRAQHLPGLKCLPTHGPARAPRVDHPLGPVSIERRLHRERRGQRGQLIVLRAAERSLADQAALGLGAYLRVSTIPRAPRWMANVLARDAVRARQAANSAGALCRALRGAALLTRLGLAQVLRAKHRAMRGLAIDLTLPVVRPRATRLARGLLALRGAVLVAPRLSAVPSALGVARLGVALDHFISGRSDHLGLVLSGPLRGVLHV